MTRKTRHAAGRITDAPAAPLLILDGIKQAIFTLLGVLLMIVLGVRAFWSYMEDKPGRMMAQILGAMACGVFIFFPDTAENILKGIIQSVVGGTT